MHQEITIKNYRRSRKFGWGYTFTPTGEDAYSIETPSRPDHVGTLNQIDDDIASDRTWRARGGAFYNTAWFHDGKRILATWAFDIVSQPSPNESADMTTDEFFAQCEYGWRWVNGWRPPEDASDVKIRLEIQILTIQDIAHEFGITTRRARALAKNRHERFGIGQQLPGGQWVFRPDDLDILAPDTKYRKE